MRIVLVTQNKNFEWLRANFDDAQITAMSYFELWDSAGKGSEEKRATIVEEVRRSDGAILDLSSSEEHAAAGFVLGIASALAKPFSMIADTHSEAEKGNRHIHRYDLTSPEVASEFTEKVKAELLNRDSAVVANDDMPSVFISYCHTDAEYLARLKVHLQPLERELDVRTWSDTDIRPGELWREQIAAALENAGIAILLISADFLASPFIITNELPPLLEKAEQQGATVLPLILTNCRFARDPLLSKFQAVNDPRAPLSSLSPAERELYYDKVASEVERLTKTSQKEWA